LLYDDRKHIVKFLLYDNRKRVVKFWALKFTGKNNQV
jgi:hypothetical protein